MENSSNDSNQSSPEGTGSSSTDTLFGSTDPVSSLFEPRGSVGQRLAALQSALPPAPTFLPASASAAASDPDGASHSAAATLSDLDARLASLRAFAASAGASTSNSAAQAPDHPASSPSDSSDDLQDADPWEEALKALLAACPEMRREGITIKDSHVSAVSEQQPSTTSDIINLPKTSTAQGSAATVPSSSVGSSTEAFAASPEAIQGATVCICSNPSDSTQLRRLSPMQLAARNGCQLCLEQLVKVPETDPLSKNVHSPLCLAIEGRYLECVKILLQADDADVVHQLSLEQSPLQVAASTGCVEIISFLLERDADALLTTPMHPLAPVLIAASKGFLAAVEVLLPFSPKVLPLEPWNAQRLLQHYGWSDDVPPDDAD